MLATREVVDRIRAVDRALLCLDACSVLDIVRDPTREKYGPGHAKAALELLNQAEANPPQLVLLVSMQAQAEIGAHIDELQQASARRIQSLDETMHRTVGILRAIGVETPEPPRLEPLKFSDHARRIVDRLLATALVVQDEAHTMVKAVERVSRPAAPATRAKQSVKDCVIIETYLHVAALLRASGFGHRIVFLTANTNDFAAPGSKRLHSDLVGDFAAVEMDFSTDFLAARYSL